MCAVGPGVELQPNWPNAPKILHCITLTFSEINAVILANLWWNKFILFNLIDFPFDFSFLTMDHTRKLVLVFDSDRKIPTLPLVGMWVKNFTIVTRLTKIMKLMKVSPSAGLLFPLVENKRMLDVMTLVHTANFCSLTFLGGLLAHHHLTAIGWECATFARRTRIPMCCWHFLNLR